MPRHVASAVSPAAARLLLESSLNLPTLLFLKRPSHFPLLLHRIEKTRQPVHKPQARNAKRNRLMRGSSAIPTKEITKASLAKAAARSAVKNASAANKSSKAAKATKGRKITRTATATKADNLKPTTISTIAARSN
jgi:hypothetical protein